MRHQTAISPLGLACARETLESAGLGHAGRRAHGQLRAGTGTINDEGLYTFRVQAKDNGKPGAGVDQFDIKIWNGTDTETDPDYTAKNTIADGDIKVHMK